MRGALTSLVLLAAALGTAGSAAAGETVGAQKPLPVIELFTSQGCSSCPVADQLFAQYAKRSDVVALSFNVDYWDYLGWKDTLANPKFTARQREYAAKRGDGNVYTPQVVVDGRTHTVGSDASSIETAVQSAQKRCKTSPVGLTLSVEKSVMQISIRSESAEPQSGTVWVAVVRPEVPVTIARGENRGRTVTYHNVVRELIPVGLWSGTSTTMTLDASAILSSPGERSAVIVQQGKGGPVVAAGWF
jgi:hypothetical protein